MADGNVGMASVSAKNTSHHKLLQFVEVLSKSRHHHLEVFALPDVQDQLLHLASDLHGVAGQNIPMVENALRESLAARLLSQC